MSAKKPIVFLVICLLLFSCFVGVFKSAFATGSLFEYFNEAPNTNTNIYGVNFVAQTFTTNATAHTVSSIKLQLYVTSAGATYNVNCSVKATDGTGKPSGLVLTSGIINSSTITTDANGAMYEFLLTQLNLNISTKYAIYAMLLWAIGCMFKVVQTFVLVIPNTIGALLPEATNPNPALFPINPLIILVSLFFTFGAWIFMFELVIQRPVV